jgi:TolB-like protein/AraC-like DNA-binding protein
MEHIPESRDEVFLHNVREAILKNLENERFGVSELADEVAISRFQIHRKLKSLKGLSVSQFIREIRLEEAMKLLKKDVGTASEISFKVGFSSPSYFNKCFQERYGYPPGEVKKMREIPASQQVGIPEQNTGSKIKVPPHSANKQKSIIGKPALLIFLGVVIVAAVWYFFLQRKHASSNMEKSIAVLPLSNLSTDPNNQFFADGLVEDLLTRLSTIKGFRVISRTSSEMYRKKGTKSIPQIADELGVAYIIEGSVQRDDGKARINIQLIEAKSDTHIWSKLFDRDLDDIFEIQSEIAIQIASELNTILSAQQTNDIQKNRTDNVKAFEFYQLGRFYWNKRTGDGYRTSIEYFEKAIAEDPDYGLAYAGLADTYNLMTLQRWTEEKKGRDKTEELALRALELDASLAEAHNVLASIYTYIDLDWEGAEREYLKAIAINPNYSTVHHYYSEHLSIMGRHNEAREHIDKALQLDPLSFIIRYVSAKLYFNRGLFQEALAENQRCQELLKDHLWSVWGSFEINYKLGADSAALASFKHFGRISGEYDPDRADSVHLVSGLDGLLKWRIELTKETYNKAEYYGLLGDNEKAMNTLEVAFNQGNYNKEFTFKYAFKNLWPDPRFKALLQRMGLPRT